MKKTIALLVALALLVTIPLAFTGCQAEENPLLIAIGGEPVSLDPFNVVDHLSPVIQQAIFEGLLAIGEKNTLVPRLAREFTVSPDGREITFLLREGVVFHDGSKFDAGAVKANFDFLLDPANAMARRNLFDFVTDIVVNSPYSITFRAGEPHYALAYFFAHPAASLKSARELEKRLQDRDYNLTHTAVGTGPFKLRQWYGGLRIELIANEDYWNENFRRKATGITFFFARPAEKRLAMLKRGEVEMIYDLTASEWEALSNVDAVDIITLPRQDIYYIGLDTALRQFSDLRVRQAMNYALDRERLLRALSVAGQPADAPLSPAVFGHHPSAPFALNRTKAKELMRDAGFANGFRATLHTRDTFLYHTIAKEIARQLATINIELEIVTHSAGELFTLIEAGEGVDMWVGHSLPHSGEADEALRSVFAEAEVALNQARRTVELSRALEKYRDISETLYRDSTEIFLFYPTRLAAVHTSINGVRSSPTGVFLVSGGYRETESR